MTMTSRERVRKAINHQPTDRVPIDMGSTTISTIHYQTLKRLREKLGLPEKLLTLTDPLLQCASVEKDVRDALQIDCVGVYGLMNLAGTHNKNFKKWPLPDGTTVLVSGDFAYSVGEDGTVYAYAEGNMDFPPCAKMPEGGFYFDPIPRQEDLDEKEDWDAREDYKNDFRLLTEEELRALEDESIDLFNNTQCALVGQYDRGGLGDAFHVPCPWITSTKGVRSMPDWMMALYSEPEYIKDLFAMQTEYTIENLKLYKQAMGERIDVIEVTATDFAHQNGLMISQEMFRELFKPFYEQVTTWVHTNTNWKTFIHSCGAVEPIIPDIIDAGFDILNPIQVSAKGMEADKLKEKYGKDLVFWGGGCNPQQTMPSATPEEVYNETRQTAAILSRGGGFVGGNIHNVQPDVPVDNLLAELQALRDTVPEAI